MDRKKGGILYIAVKRAVALLYPKTELLGLENIPEEPVIAVGNHCQMHGPVNSELYYPGAHKTWCAWQMMELREVPDYAYRDFWSEKPLCVRWIFRLASYLIAPMSVFIFRRAETIAVYHDGRLMRTFRQTMQSLEQGERGHVP